MLPQDQYQEAKSRLNLAKCFKQEVHLSFHYMRYNIDNAFLPFLIFPIASLLHREADIFEILRSLSYALPYGFLYAYTIDLANSAAGDGLEDAINKPNRPVVSNKTSVAATKVRYYVSSGLWVIYSYILNVHIWTMVWIFTVFSSYMLHTAKFGPTKDLSMALGTVAQLMACWELGGSNIELGWTWVKIIATWVFFTGSIQDFRDVPGDKACGRRTTPMLLGDIPARIYTSCSLVFFEYFYIFHWVLDQQYRTSTLMISVIIAVITITLIFRMTFLRKIEDDRVSYRWYSALYISLLIAACLAFGKI